MCGIVGFIGRGNLDDLERMSECIEHRGPDATGSFYDDNKCVYLAHKRLSIIDLDGGSQPMWTADRTLCVIFNGEIYNHLELRKELENLGHNFHTDHSDTEVLLHGFREWGNDLPMYLNGMWAFAIYDKGRGVIFLSRDRFGKKPLFYTLQNKTFVFASELSALIKHPFVEASISRRSLKKYFAYGYIPAPGSLYSDVCKLPGGHNLTFNLNNFVLQVWKYWDFVIEPFESIPKNPEDEWGEQIRELLQKSVQRRLMSDVPLGVFLSGGIDSSSIVAFAKKISGDHKVKTFAIGFSETSFDESGYAQTVSNLFNTEHHLAKLSLKGTRELLPEIIKRLDEPMGDSSLLPTYMLCSKTKKHVTVALSGDGGDELFAGYDPFRALHLAELYSTIVPRPVHKGIRLIMSFFPVSHQNISLDFKIKRTLRGLSYPKELWNPVWMGSLEPKELDDLFLEPTDMEEVYSEAIECWESCHSDNLVDRALQFYTRLYLQNDILVKTDRASMMNSLEVRAPFLDIDLVDFVRKIPHTWKYRNGKTKYILKKAMEPVLPDSIISRPKKGFGVPIGSWLQKGLLPIEIKKSEKKYGIKGSFIKHKLYEHQQNKRDHREFLWNLWLLNMWHNN